MKKGTGKIGGNEVVEKPSSFQVLEVEKFLVITKPSTWVAKVEQS